MTEESGPMSSDDPCSSPTSSSPPPADQSVEVRTVSPSEWYKLGPNPLRMAATLYLCEICKLLPISVKNTIYRTMGVDIGTDTTIAPHVQVDPLFPGRLSIGDGTVIGWGTKLLTHEAYSDEWHVGPVEIGDNVTVGHSSSTRPGITVEDGATIGAHSFVNRDVEAGEKVGGVPIETL